MTVSARCAKALTGINPQRIFGYFLCEQKVTSVSFPKNRPIPPKTLRKGKTQRQEVPMKTPPQYVSQLLALVLGGIGAAFILLGALFTWMDLPVQGGGGWSFSALGFVLLVGAGLCLVWYGRRKDLCRRLLERGKSGTCGLFYRKMGVDQLEYPQFYKHSGAKLPLGGALQLPVGGQTLHRDQPLGVEPARPGPVPRHLCGPKTPPARLY